ncbi:MAG: transposase [Gammaproteobacteria bacterium]
MSRPLRFELAGVPYHVIQRGNDRRPIVVSDDDRTFLIGALALATTRAPVAIHAYVVMDNHVHLLVSPLEAGNLGRMMQSVGVRYVAWFNRRYGRSGTLFESRYRASLIEDDNHLLACQRYIEMNPVRAGIVSRPAAFCWSSHRANAYGRCDPLVVPHPTYMALGGDVRRRTRRYRSLFGTPMGSDPDAHADGVRPRTAST